MVKKIKVSKLILLTVVTLGYYLFFWLARRRNELVRQYNVSIPAWQWMVLPPVLIIPFIFIVTFVLTLTVGTWVAVLISFGLALLPLFAYLGVSIWWMQKFGAAVEKVSGGKLSTTWVLIYWMFVGFFFAFVVQPFLNEAPAKLVTKKQKPTRRFVRASIVVLSIVTVLLAALCAWVLLGSLSSSLQTVTPAGNTDDQKRLVELNAKSEALARQYDSCVKKLDETYSEVTEDQHDAYVKEYTACEDVRLEQNRAVEQYNELNTKMTFDSIFR